MNPQREQILRQLKDALKESTDEENLYKLIRQALRLRPVPNELLKDIKQKYWASKKQKFSTPMPVEKERALREVMSRIYHHSQRAQDPNHPVGIVTNAIREALPEFQSWQPNWSKVDIYRMVRSIFKGDEEGFTPLLPPDFTESVHRAYISATRTFLLLDEDGSVCTSYEMMQKNDSMDALKKQIKQGKRLSDTLSLLWKKPETIELKAIEDLLRRLSKAIIPATQIHFSPYEEPRFRAALRMQLGDNPVPAAIAGILNPRPEIYGKGNIASAIIYLEPWAAAQSGQTVELSDFSPLLDLLPKKSDQ